MNKLLFVSTTKYSNLIPECFVMVKSFYDEYTWELCKQLEQADVVINIVEDHFFVELINEERKTFNIELSEVDLRKVIKRTLYKELESTLGKTLPWGVLQGIRPTKLVFKIFRDLVKLNEEKSVKGIEDFWQEIKEALMAEYYLSVEMAELAINVAAQEEPYLPLTIEEAVNSFSVYISVPFCPTRCHYCSFPSHSMEKWSDQMGDYIKALKKEWMSIIPKLLKYKSISTVYIGGGTPTSFSAAELREVLKMVHGSLPMEMVKELTVEAGRPDTITCEKLEVLREFNVDRISINPQTMHQKTLDTIGRKHSIDQLKQAYELAVTMGFQRINMDLIIGLPNETIEDVRETINQIIEMNASEVTVHTLAIKRSSILHEDIDKYKLPNDEETKEMLELARDTLIGKGEYKPYYLYRQKNMVGSYENVGYYKSDKPCIYNIEIMEEAIPIVAFGAGGITKLLTTDGKLKRVENVKNAKAYIDRVEDMVVRKTKALYQ